MVRLLAVLICAAICLVYEGSATYAQSTNAAPVLVVTTKPLDQASLPFTSDADKQLTTSYLASTKTATGNTVLVAAANFTGATYYNGSSDNPSTIADAARAALEICEFNNKAPCIIVAINGNDARVDGGWPAQPEMLIKVPGSKFDPWAIPFNSQFNRAIAGFLTTAPYPSVMVVSNAGGWSSGSGATVLEAIDTAFSKCKTVYPNNTCILYSVNGLVLMTP